MFRFAIIDDDINDLNKIKYYIDEHFKFHNISCSLDLYNNSLNFDFNINYDAVFIDIDMPNINGIELAKMINNKKTTKIIFITNYDDFINAVFNVQPFHFIRKCNLKFEIIKVLTILLKN